MWSWEGRGRCRGQQTAQGLWLAVGGTRCSDTPALPSGLVAPHHCCTAAAAAVAVVVAAAQVGGLPAEAQE